MKSNTLTIFLIISLFNKASSQINLLLNDESLKMHETLAQASINGIHGYTTSSLTLRKSLPTTGSLHAHQGKYLIIVNSQHDTTGTLSAYQTGYLFLELSAAQYNYLKETQDSYKSYNQTEQFSNIIRDFMKKNIAKIKCA